MNTIARFLTIAGVAVASACAQSAAAGGPDASTAAPKVYTRLAPKFFPVVGFYKEGALVNIKVFGDPDDAFDDLATCMHKLGEAIAKQNASPSSPGHVVGTCLPFPVHDPMSEPGDYPLHDNKPEVLGGRNQESL